MSKSVNDIDIKNMDLSPFMIVIHAGTSFYRVVRKSGDTILDLELSMMSLEFRHGDAWNRKQNGTIFCTRLLGLKRLETFEQGLNAFNQNFAANVQKAFPEFNLWHS